MKKYIITLCVLFIFKTQLQSQNIDLKNKFLQKLFYAASLTYSEYDTPYSFDELSYFYGYAKLQGLTINDFTKNEQMDIVFATSNLLIDNFETSKLKYEIGNKMDYKKLEEQITPFYKSSNSEILKNFIAIFIKISSQQPYDFDKLPAILEIDEEYNLGDLMALCFILENEDEKKEVVKRLMNQNIELARILLDELREGSSEIKILELINNSSSKMLEMCALVELKKSYLTTCEDFQDWVKEDLLKCNPSDGYDNNYCKEELERLKAEKIKWNLYLNKMEALGDLGIGHAYLQVADYYKCIENTDEATQFYKKSAKLNNGEAMENLGNMMLDNNKKAALDWYFKAERFGGLYSSDKIMDIYDEGLYNQEIVNFAISQQTNFGLLESLINRSTNTNKKKELINHLINKYKERIEDFGDPMLMYELAGHYEYYKEDISNWKNEAKKWFSKSCDLGNENSCIRYKKLQK